MRRRICCWRDRTPGRCRNSTCSDGCPWPRRTLVRSGTFESEISSFDTRAEMKNDLQILTDLNREYIGAVQHADVGRFEEILAPDFICITADGERLDRTEFLRRTAVRTTIQGLE